MFLLLAICQIGPQARPPHGQSDPPPRPSVSITSPADGSAFNGSTVSIEVEFHAWVDPETGDVGNVRDVDLLLGDEILETIPHTPPVTEGSETFDVDISGFDDRVLEFVAHAYQGNRHAGLFQASEVIRVLVDRTPPTLEVTWPPNEEFGTDLDSISIEGMAADNLSGIVQVSLTSSSATVSLTHPEFASLQFLDTGVSDSDPVAENPFTIHVSDAAGNTTSSALLVNYTLQATIVPLNDEDLVEFDGLPLSPRHAFIVFQQSTTREDRHAIVQESGGRVAGLLDELDTVLAIFEDCHTVIDLIAILDSLDDDSRVKGIQLDYLLDAQQATLDNDIVGTGPGQPAVAYGNVLSSDAINWIQTNVPTNELRPVSIAVLDTGLDTTAGNGSEFNGALFVDATEVAYGLLPTSAPFDLESRHGTAAASVAAGANNGAGNNGVGTLLGGPAIQLIAYRVFKNYFLFGEKASPHAVAAAANDAVKRGASVGNMSFAISDVPALISTATMDRELFQEIFARSPDILWVVTASNDGDEIDCDLSCDVFCNPVLPTQLSCEFLNVVSVAAHTPQDVTANGTAVMTDELLPTSNYDNSNLAVQISAPGALVLTARPSVCGAGIDPPPGYGCFSGTSAAAPMVAGAAALIRAVSDAPAGEIRDILVFTGRPTPATNPHVALDTFAAVRRAHDVPQFPDELHGATTGGETVAVEPGLWPTDPGLNSFSFQYLDDDDHEVDEIKVLTSSEEVSVAYNDQNDDDFFSWQIEGVALPVGTVYGSVEGSSPGGCVDSNPLPLAGNGVYVLTGFAFDYPPAPPGDGVDHEIDVLSVRFVESANPLDPNPRVQVCFQGQTQDDWTYRVDYALIPSSHLIEFGTTGLQQADPEDDAGSQQYSINFSAQGLPLISGFSFDFIFFEHQLDNLQVDISTAGTVTVAFRDKNDDDPYFWLVDWALITP